MFRQIRDDTRALIADLKRLGARLTTRWQWMRLRSKKRLEGAGADLENVRRAAGVRMRMCRECRALVPTSARLCPECGQRPGAAVATGLSRVALNMVPGAISVSTALMTLILLVYGLNHLAAGRLSAGATLTPDLRPQAWAISQIALGANVPAFVLEGEVWRLLTMVFLHGNLLHLLMNGWAFLSLGPLIEELYGPRKLLLFFVLTGVGGALASFAVGLASPVRVAVGASGALFGLMGVAAVWGWRRGGAMGQGVRGLMVQWAMYGLVMGLLIPGVDNAAHVGGLLTGAAIALLVPDSAPRTAAGDRFWTGLAWLAGLAIAGSLVMTALRYAATVSRIVEVYSGHA